MISVLNSAAISLRVSGIWSSGAGLVCSVAAVVQRIPAILARAGREAWRGL
jgi:hypothetical protein